MYNQEFALYSHYYGIEPTCEVDDIDELVNISGHVVLPDIRWFLGKEAGESRQG